MCVIIGCRTVHAFDPSGHHIENKPLILGDSEKNSEFAVLGEGVLLLIDVNTDTMHVSFLFCFKEWAFIVLHARVSAAIM